MQKIPVKNIPKYAKHNNLALILFGSYSRGDYDLTSDIDVLEVTQRVEKPYSNGEINFSTYSLEQLRKMASEGNLFILHLILEGKLISGDTNLLKIIERSFIKRKSYESFRTEIVLTARLLDVTEEQFSINSKGYYGLLCYLFRSYLYSMMYDEGSLKFSIKEISKKYNDSNISEVFSKKHQKTITFSEFIFCKSVFQKYAKSKLNNNFIDSIDLLKAVKEKSKFGFSVALHFLVDLANELYSH